MQKRLTRLLSGLATTLAVSMSASFAGYASTVVTNVTGYTLNPQGEMVTFNTIVFDEGKVVQLNPTEMPADATVIDGNNKVLLPGLIDAHGHLLGLGGNLMEVDLRESSSMQQAAQWVADYAMMHADQEWIKGRGWNQELWSDRSFPTAAVLDAKLKNKPVWLTRVDGHAAWVNSKALQMAGINDSTPDPAGGQILRDADGKATGVLIDHAMDLVSAIMPKDRKSVV